MYFAYSKILDWRMFCTSQKSWKRPVIKLIHVAVLVAKMFACSRCCYLLVVSVYTAASSLADEKLDPSRHCGGRIVACLCKFYWTHLSYWKTRDNLTEMVPSRSSRCIMSLYASCLHLVKNRGGHVYTKNASFVPFRNGPATSHLGMTMLLSIHIEIPTSIESMTS